MYSDSNFSLAIFSCDTFRSSSPSTIALKARLIVLLQIPKHRFAKLKLRITALGRPSYNLRPETPEALPLYVSKEMNLMSAASHVLPAMAHLRGSEGAGHESCPINIP